MGHNSQLKYRQRIFLWFGIIFLLFTIGIIVFEQSKEKRYKTEIIIEKLDSYTEIINKAFSKGELNNILNVLPLNIRITILDKHGTVLFDNTVSNVSVLENHIERPEIQLASKNNNGYNIRTSTTNKLKYLYYTKCYNSKFIRVAVPYNIKIEHFLRPDNGFLYFIITLFIVALFFINRIAERFSKSIKQLRDFTIAAEKNKSINMSYIKFPNDELGEIGKRIVNVYQTIENNEKKITQEREKLLQHVHSSEEGLCFFSPDRKVEFYNGLFIQYLNILVDNAIIEPSMIFSTDFFEQANIFLNNNQNEKYFETLINKQGKHFSIRINLFDDNSFEINIHDYTKQEKTRQLKQEITGNIAHELRTPVTSIRGYLETILNQCLSQEKERDFIDKAYKQTLNLSELISDISMISKIENAPDMFKMENVNIVEIIERVFEDFDTELKEQQITTQVNIPTDTIVNGNENLLYSIFRNLTENVINYAGKNIKINIELYNTDNNFYYFSFSDNGTGIKDEQHLNRLFERFYRINEGRTRDMGRTGLGLSIVKNAILLHKGNIVVKNKINGGLEFNFKLRNF